MPEELEGTNQLTTLLFFNRENGSVGNTTVTNNKNGGTLLLHGNPIAKQGIYSDPEYIRICNGTHPSRLTAARLKAITEQAGCDFHIGFSDGQVVARLDKKEVVIGQEWITLADILKELK